MYTCIHTISMQTTVGAPHLAAPLQLLFKLLCVTKFSDIHLIFKFLHHEILTTLSRWSFSALWR